MESLIFTYICGVLFCALVYVGGVVYYRLFLSPLAKFPGPRLAAATGLYETYFQLVKDGKFTWEIQRLHQIYGPVIRIKPSELHIQDPDYYNTLYAGNTRKRDRDPWFYYIGWPRSVFSTEGHDLHLERRRVVSQSFKKPAILDFQPVIQANILSLCNHLSVAAKNGKALDLHACFLCFAVDTISRHAFGNDNSFHYLDQPELTAQFKTRVNACFELIKPVRHLPFIYWLAHVFPLPAGIVASAFKPFYQMEQEVKQKVRIIIAQRNQGKIGESKAIYPSILDNKKVAPSEKEYKRLADDALFLIVAGTDAPAQALAITLFHILNNDEVHRRVTAELFSAFPDIGSTPSLDQFEKLPYLTATLKEGLRLSSIVTTRLPRQAPNEVLQVHGWSIPPGTTVSMSTYFILRDPNIFPQPSSFLPERWLLDPEELRKLERYLVPFSKGIRGCLGPNMTWAWLYMVLGTILRRFELTLHETTERNVEMTRDCFIGQTDPGLNIVQVKVLNKYKK